MKFFFWNSHHFILRIIVNKGVRKIKINFSLTLDFLICKIKEREIFYQKSIVFTLFLFICILILWYYTKYILILVLQAFCETKIWFYYLMSSNSLSWISESIEVLGWQQQQNILWILGLAGGGTRVFSSVASSQVIWPAFTHKVP